MISHAVVPRELLPRNVLPRLLCLQDEARGRVLRVQKRNHDHCNDEDDAHVEPPGAVEVLDGFGLEEVVADTQQSAFVHETLHIL